MAEYSAVCFTLNSHTLELCSCECLILIAWIDKWLLASQEGLGSMELFNMLKINIPVVFTHVVSWNQSVYLNEPNLNIGGIISM